MELVHNLMNPKVSEKALFVLIVEDSEDDALLLERELKKGGYRVIAERVDSAVAFTSALERQPWHLIIADYSMPGFNGLEALHLLKSHDLDIPFIVVSGFLTEESAVDALRAGAHDFILKGKTARLLPAIDRELRELEDRTTRREMEAKVQQAEDRLRIAVEAAELTVWHWDIVKNTVVYGDYYENIFGEMPVDVEEDAKTLQERIHTDDRERLMSAVKATLEEDAPFRLEYRVIWQDESVHWLQAHGRAHRDKQGKVISMTGVLQNITDHKRVHDLELEQERLKGMLEKQQELARLQSRFMAMVAHEFRTPLTVISSANELLYSYYDQLSAEKHKEYLAEIAARVKYLREMLTQIETVTREEHVTKEFSPYLTDIVALCRRVIRQIQDETGNTHKFELQHTEPTVEVAIDGRLLGHILSHLLTNSVRYSKKGTTIQIKLATASTCLMLDVTDQGIGILPEDMPHIFELFFRGGNIGAVNGRGIGLKIVRDCVESHNGVISVQSDVGRGTTFTVQLPLS